MKKYLMKKKFLKSITLIILLNLFLATNSNAVVLYKTDEGKLTQSYRGENLSEPDKDY